VLKGDDVVRGKIGDDVKKGETDDVGRGDVSDDVRQGDVMADSPSDAGSNSSEGSVASSNSSDFVTVGALTCLQLADTILKTPTQDFTRLYQLCGTKIR
jgi:hypothetical protein